MSFKRARLRGDRSFEQNLTTGIIADTDFLREMRCEVEENINHIGSSALRRIIGWCFEYYDRFGRAPHLNIQDIFEDKRTGLSLAEEDLVEEFLVRLSEKYEEIDDFAGEFEVASIRAVFHQVRMEEVLRQAGELVKDRRPDEAYELVIKKAPWIRKDKDLESVLLTVTEFITTKIARPKRFIKPWLTSHSLNMIYGPRGIGKTWLTHILAIAMTRQEPADSIGPWETRAGASVLLVDGEMGKAAIQHRLKFLVETYGMDEGKGLYLLAEELDLSSEKTRVALGELAKQKEIEVVFLDNLSCLFPGLDENKKQDWDPINQWLLSLRAAGLGVVMVHHSGKTGKQRGTSGREDSLDCIIKLSRPRNYQPSDGARFWVQFEKARNALPSAKLDSFELSVRDLFLVAG